MTRNHARAAERYFLPEDYQSAPEIVTFNDGSGRELYWHPKRLKAASTYLFQFPVYQYALEQIRKYGCASLVDVGCGPGAKLSYIHRYAPHLAITGIDQKDAIDFCKSRHGFGNWVVDNFDAPGDLDIPRADIGICSDVIEHVGDPDKLLSYLKQRVKPGGLIVLSTPDRVARYGTKLMVPGHPAHVREWSYEELADYLNASGFVIIDHFNQWPVRVSASKVFVREIIKQMRSGNKVRYNQVCLLRNPA